MIHIDFADGHSEWLTDEQLKEKYPDLHAALRKPAPLKEYGDMLKKIRQRRDISLREMSKRIGCKASDLSNIEQGYVEATAEQVEAYQRLQQEVIL